MKNSFMLFASLFFSHAIKALIVLISVIVYVAGIEYIMELMKLQNTGKMVTLFHSLMVQNMLLQPPSSFQGTMLRDRP